MSIKVHLVAMLDNYMFRPLLAIYRFFQEVSKYINHVSIKQFNNFHILYDS